MENSTNDIIKYWKSVYYLYLEYNEVDPALFEQCWVTRTQSMISYWEKMVSGEVPKTYEDFNHLMKNTVDYYDAINRDYYSRFGKQVAQTKNTGGRRWL